MNKTFKIIVYKHSTTLHVGMYINYCSNTASHMYLSWVHPHQTESGHQEAVKS